MGAPLTKSRRRSPASLVLEANHISQHKLADALELSKSSLSRVLRGEQPQPPNFAKELRLAIGAADIAAEILRAVRAATP